MSKRDALSGLEEIVLLAVMRLGPDSYGVTIREEIGERTGRDVSLGSIYPTLDRLEDQGLVRSRRGDPTGERGGRSRRHFQLMPPGLEALRRARREVTSMWAGFEADAEVRS